MNAHPSSISVDGRAAFSSLVDPNVGGGVLHTTTALAAALLALVASSLPSSFAEGEEEEGAGGSAKAEWKMERTACVCAV